MSSKFRCKGCGEYVEKDRAVHIGLSRFCSRDCYFRSISETQRPKKVAPKRTLPSVKDEPSEEIRLKVLQRDRHRCRLCGRSQGLVPHHIYYRSEAKREPWLHSTHNLITLCNSPCHLSIIHGNKKKFKPILLGLVWLSEVENKYMTIEQFEKKYVS